MENVQLSEHGRSTEREVYFSSLLIDKIESENFDEVKWLLLHNNVNPNFILPNEGISPMHILAGLENESFSVDVMEIALVERGGDPNVRSADGLTPVHLAAIWGRSAVLEILLKFGGNPFLQEYKFSLNAEDLAFKERQWQTHAILATFSVFNDKHEPLDDGLHSSLHKPSSENVRCWLNGSGENAISNEYIPDCRDSISKNIEFLSMKCNNMSLGDTGPQKKDACFQTTQSKPLSCHKESSYCNGNRPFDGKDINKQNNILEKKNKMSDQFDDKFTKFKNFFGRARIPKLFLTNSSKDGSNRNTRKQSI